MDFTCVRSVEPDVFIYVCLVEVVGGCEPIALEDLVHKLEGAPRDRVLAAVDRGIADGSLRRFGDSLTQSPRSRRWRAGREKQLRKFLEPGD